MSQPGLAWPGRVPAVCPSPSPSLGPGNRGGPTQPPFPQAKGSLALWRQGPLQCVPWGDGRERSDSTRRQETLTVPPDVQGRKEFSHFFFFLYKDFFFS